MKIKSCPFCGGRAGLDVAESSYGKYINNRKELTTNPSVFHVVCYNCLVRTMDYQNSDDAIMAWNKRCGESFPCDREKCKGCEQFGWVCDLKRKGHGYFTCRLQNKKCADTYITAEFIIPQHFSESQIVLYDD